MLDYVYLFLDHHMKGARNGVEKWPPVQAFLMGENRWVGLEDWPPPGAEYQDWFLHSSGRAHTNLGDGELSQDRPRTSSTVTFLYDPSDPLPTTGGQSFGGETAITGPVDERPHLKRADVLYYRGPKLQMPMTVAGDIELSLRVCSSAEDTDFTARFCVEEASGRVVALTNGVARCRYREGWDCVVPLVPGQEVDMQIHMNHTAYTFPAGSRIALMVSSSDCPRIMPHHNTMAKPLAEHNPRKAENTVHQGPDGRSFLRLPVVRAIG